MQFSSEEWTSIRVSARACRATIEAIAGTSCSPNKRAGIGSALCISIRRHENAFDSSMNWLAKQVHHHHLGFCRITHFENRGLATPTPISEPFPPQTSPLTRNSATAIPVNL
jgi:hypothetical protein